MPDEYRWFRQDEIVRRCVLINGFFSTETAGFDTVLEVRPDEQGNVPEDATPILEKYAYLKHAMDGLNQTLNMDDVLLATQIKRSVFGKCGWEIVANEGKLPTKLVALESDKLKPELDDNWDLESYEYDGKKARYKPEEVFYILNLQLEGDKEGLSDVEPIVPKCLSRHEVMDKDFPEIAKTLWAPYAIAQADTTRMSDADAQTFLNDLAEKLKAGKQIAVNQAVTVQVISMTINFEGLIKMLDKIEEAIRRAFGTPRFLIGLPIENRATAYAEIEAYVDGPISHIQRHLKRVMEQWYDRWTRLILEEKGERYDPEKGERPPVRLVHKWRPIRTADIYAMADAAAKLWGQMGMGPLGGRLKKVWSLMGWDPDELGELERQAEALVHEANADWIDRSTPGERENQDILIVRVNSLRAMLVDLVNNALKGETLEETITQASAVIRRYFQLVKENARGFLAREISVPVKDPSPEQDRRFDEKANSWINDFRRILTDALMDVDTGPLMMASHLPFVEHMTYRALMASTDDFWLSKAGIWTRLNALSHDLVIRIHNAAYKIYSSQTGFYWFEWVTQPTLTKSGPCADCLQFDGRTYRRGMFMPNPPRHVYCVCYYRITSKEEASLMRKDQDHEGIKRQANLEAAQRVDAEIEEIMRELR